VHVVYLCSGVSVDIEDATFEKLRGSLKEASLIKDLGFRKEGDLGD